VTDALVLPPSNTTTAAAMSFRGTIVKLGKPVVRSNPTFMWLIRALAIPNHVLTIWPINCGSVTLRLKSWVDVAHEQIRSCLLMIALSTISKKIFEAVEKLMLAHCKQRIASVPFIVTLGHLVETCSYIAMRPLKVLILGYQFFRYFAQGCSRRYRILLRTSPSPYRPIKSSSRSAWT
jgi:hypothetical protein